MMCVKPRRVGCTFLTWPDEAIKLLKTGQVEEISLDHDLGDAERGTGYDVVLWIEDVVATEGFTPPKLVCIRQIVSRGREWNPVSHLSCD